MRIFSLCRRESRGKSKSFKPENSRKTESRALSFSRLRRQLPLGGSLCLCAFFPLCRRESRGKSKSFKPENSRKTESRALSFSRLRRQLPLGGSLCSCVPFLCAAEKTRIKFKVQNSKSHFFLLRRCSFSTVAFLREEGVTRKRDGRSPRDGKAAGSRGFSAFQRQSLTRFAGAPFTQGSLCLCVFFPLCHRENRSKNQDFKTESGSKTKVSHSPSVAFGDSSLSEGAFVRAFFPLCRREIFSTFPDNKKRFFESSIAKFRKIRTINTEKLQKQHTGVTVKVTPVFFSLYGQNRPCTGSVFPFYSAAISASRRSTSARLVAQLVQKRTTVPCGTAPSSSK